MVTILWFIYYLLALNVSNMGLVKCPSLPITVFAVLMACAYDVLIVAALANILRS